ncbi:LOW QUALITY PROTEIN: two-component response regulator-like APRR3 [Impatiens glandulifera]|uniref:LOW QUALITY PROTEIN: two-component response regulator-like APRR3 n=1 Tax=Impatiens glandulifera TaxID=253017 RepID=UPI001FB17830|nr:LOW QUALITY PROTEIN: two-component response regulator-like APRR3 [Impatiens glandulifera]
MTIEAEEEDTGNKVDASTSMMRWERFLPRMVLRVLLVEADDSTRHIIAALLRKCSYKVAAVADGLKAWELLKGKPKNIDLILTEVDLPSISGFALLTLITEHEICKKIPVIMMSSQDSVTMVYKCMLRGSADFLVKPVRKNELKNLWQHVWRRQSSIGIGRSPLNESVTQQKLEATAENDYATNPSSGFIASIQRNRERIDKGSDAQSSCRKPEMEGDGDACHEESLDEPPLKSLMPKKKLQTDIDHEEAKLVALEKDDEGDEKSLSGVPNMNSELACAVTTNPMVINASSTEAIGLIGAFDHISNSGYRNCSSNSYTNKVELNLSLRSRSSYPDENYILKQSTVSAFSRYVSSKTLEPSSQSVLANNQSRSPPSPPKDHGTADDSEKQTSNHIQDCNNNITTALGSGLSRQVEISFPRPQQLRYLSVPVPVRGMGLPVMPPIYYAQSGSNSMLQSLGSVCSSQEASFFMQRSNINIDSRNCRDFSLLMNQQRQQAANNNSGNKSGSFGNNGTMSSINYMSKNVEGGGHTHTHSHSHSHRLVLVSAGQSENEESFLIQNRDNNQYGSGSGAGSDKREAALKKFRLKRKERCFEKKVRYESRKKLAEERPRVKGQFVRQASG